MTHAKLLNTQTHNNSRFQTKIADCDLGTLIHDLARLRQKKMDFMLKPIKITPSQATLITLIAESSGNIQSYFAEKMGVGRAPIGELIDRLEKSQLIERKVDKNDRRIRKIYLTEKGEKIGQSIAKITEESNKNMLADLSFNDAEHTSRTIKKLINNLAIFPDTDTCKMLDRSHQ